jgi:hypothetical protein
MGFSHGSMEAVEKSAAAVGFAAVLQWFPITMIILWAVCKRFCEQVIIWLTNGQILFA